MDTTSEFDMYEANTLSFFAYGRLRCVMRVNEMRICCDFHTLYISLKRVSSYWYSLAIDGDLGSRSETFSRSFLGRCVGANSVNGVSNSVSNSLWLIKCNLAILRSKRSYDHTILRAGISGSWVTVASISTGFVYL